MLLLLAVACSEGSAPDQPSGVGAWALPTLDGQTLPIRLGSGATFSDIQGDTLFLIDGPGSSWHSTIRDSTTVPNACCNQAITPETDLTWRVAGDSLTYTAVYPSGVAHHGGRLKGDTLTVTLTDGGFLPDGLYRYIRE